MTPIVAIKIDVDTHDGMRDGVPRLLAKLKQHGLPGTFFLTLGPDRSGRALWQLRHPAFLRKMMTTNAPSLYGWRTILSGTLLPARPVATAFPALVKRIEDEGHETAIHAWDHRAWQDDLPHFKDRRIRLHFERSFNAYRSLTGHDPQGIGAPAWMTTPRSLAIQDEFPLRYASDLRGGIPCYLHSTAGRHRLPQIPATGPCLEELLGQPTNGTMPYDHCDTLLHHLTNSPSPVRILTLHAEVEGGPYLSLLDQLLPKLQAIGPVVTMASATKLIVHQLPTRQWCMGTLIGRAFPVSSSVMQADIVSR
jgi:undecaprenyl phosphate-alpha-L-ara4FN deformylase